MRPLPKQQKIVSEEMNQNVIYISDQSSNATSEADALQQSAFRLTEMAQGLQNQLNTINTGVSASDFDFDGAKQAHLAWKTRLRTYLDGDKSVLTKEQACSHRDCKLGQWYYGEGIKEYNNITSFKEIEVPHEKLHSTIKSIVLKTEQGDMQGAELLYKEIEPLSDTIVKLIDQTKKSVS
ncbi:CZB domain-containing protein [Psychromonas sp. KJ10-10]|uniref:CZB domain-containing protein n=1 Tax=Psychromonas sp. KJ10-10 TaxID=3391823 RepID=UPI0039B5481D